MSAIPAQSLVDAISGLITGDNSAMLTAHFLRLFTNDVQPSHGMTSGTFVYGSQSIDGLGATSITANTLVITPGTFAWQGLPTLVNGGLFIGEATVGYPVQIFGYVAVGSDSVTPVYAERLPVPVTITGQHQGLTINPKMGWSNTFIG